MATITRKVDDFDGNTELADDVKSTRVQVTDNRVALAFDIDLSDANVEKLVKALAPFSKKGRELTPKGAKTSGSSKSEAAQEAADARAWAMSERPDLKVSERGRVSDKVVEEYRAFLLLSDHRNATTTSSADTTA